MAHNLKKFQTEAEYSAATLNYPAVSWVTSNDTVMFDKTAPSQNDKIMMSFTTDSGDHFVFYNCEASDAGDITSISVDDVAVTPIACNSTGDTEEALHIIKYGLNTTVIGDWFSGELGSDGSNAPSIEILIPEQITEIGHLPANAQDAVVILATTPPELTLDGSSWQPAAIYVPDNAVNTYKAASVWNQKEEYIHPLSDYQGNLPV